ncbi:hypothetical protein [Methanococcoides sp. LMO-2]|uniref:Uncharacterized protein n=1 Tax=Methanococcoides cohabitans TaxID=3136559 RepID=A0ABU9KZR2_9EURY
MKEKIYLDNEKKCYFCGRTDEDGKNMFHALNKNLSDEDSVTFYDLSHAFEIKEYDVKLSNFIKERSSEMNAFTDLDWDTREDIALTIFACPVCLSVLRNIGECNGRVV